MCGDLSINKYFELELNFLHISYCWSFLYIYDCGNVKDHNKRINKFFFNLFVFHRYNLPWKFVCRNYPISVSKIAIRWYQRFFFKIKGQIRPCFILSLVSQLIGHIFNVESLNSLVTRTNHNFKLIHIIFNIR